MCERVKPKLYEWILLVRFTQFYWIYVYVLLYLYTVQVVERELSSRELFLLHEN